MEGILRCWKCRRFVLDAGSLSLSSGGESSKIQNAAEESAGQIDCTVWHVNLDAIPVWIRKEIEKSWWTIGKLNCQHCGARLGDFNFVCPAKCPCGQTLTVHLCKSRTDYEPPRLIRISEPAEVKSLQKLQYTHMLETVEKMEHGTENSLFRYRQKDFLHHSRKMDHEKMTDALCLEARSHSRGIVEVDSKEFNFKAACSQPCSSASQPVRDRCPVKGFHRKTLSLDFNRKDSKDASVSFASIHGLGPRSSSCGLVTNHPDETASPMQQIQLAEDSNLQPPAREESNGSLFPGQFMKESDFLLSPQSLHHHPVEEECEDVDPGPSVPSHCRRNAAHISSIVRGWSPDSSTEASDVEEWDEGHEAGASNPWDDSTPCVPLFSTVVDRPLNKRQRNKLKSLKRKQRKWQRWHQSKLKEQNQASSSNLTTSDDDEIKWEKEGYICAVCLDIFFSPYMCYPCHHIFCEPCLRTLAKDNPTSTPCPLCRTIITRVFFQSDLNNTMRSLFSEEYLARRQSFQKASCAKWPLPSCRRLIKILGGFGRRPDPVARRQFPHGAYRLDFEDDNRGWRFDMDMVIIYIYSVNWVIGFIIFCFLCYFFFPSF